MIEYRGMIQSDFPFLLRLCYEFENSPYNADPDFRKLGTEFFPVFGEKMLRDHQTSTVVAAERGKVIGFLSFAVNKGLSSAISLKIANILLLAVDREYRGRGIGRELVSRAQSLLKTGGVKMATVGTDLNNFPAIRSYESCGFKTAMSWHILRFYQGQRAFSRNTKIKVEPFPLGKLEYFRPYFSRPVSLLNDPQVNTSDLKDFLYEGIRAQLLKGNTIPLAFYENGDIAGMINIVHDQLAEESLKGDAVIYRVLDWIALGERKKEIRSALMIEALYRLRDFSMTEIWVKSDDYDTLKAAEQIGFEIRYSGVNLHWTAES